jgi:hypothetical protein
MMDGNDGPTLNFLKYMEERHFTPDSNWNGIKENEDHGH